LFFDEKYQNFAVFEQFRLKCRAVLMNNCRLFWIARRQGGKLRDKGAIYIFS